MPQRFRLDRGRHRSYVFAGLILAVAACRSAPASVMPAGLAPIDAATAAAWARALRPSRPRLLRLRWRFTTQQGSAAGRAVVRYQPGDTLRFDYRAPFGRSGAALFVGREVIWAEPAEELRQLVPAAPLFWAGVGLPLGPRPGVTVRGRARGDERAWRAAEGPDGVLGVIWQPDERQLMAELVRGTRIVGVSAVQYDAAGNPLTAELRFPAEAARLTFRFEAVDTVAQFSPDTWRRP